MLAIGCVRIGNGGCGKMPLLLFGGVLAHAGSAQTCEIGNQIVASLVAEEEAVRGHEGGAADFARIE